MVDVSIMCILFATKGHPEYELILISNRDEFFERETHITCWHNNDSILSPYDMAKRKFDTTADVFGTWIGINRSGRVATILNLKSDEVKTIDQFVKPKSRGLIPFTYLLNGRCDDALDFDEWDNYMKFKESYPNLGLTGDFNFFYGDIKKSEYRIIDSVGHTYKVLDEKNGLNMVTSNDLYRKDKSKTYWKKINRGKELLAKFLVETKDNDKDTIIQKCFELSSDCTLNGDSHIIKDPTITSETIFVPPLECKVDIDTGLTPSNGKYFGTRSQIVLLVDKNKHVTFIEHIIHTNDDDIHQFSASNPKNTERIEFDIN